LISTKALLDRVPDPTLEQIREALSSNLCRCTGYMQIYESVRLALQRWGRLPVAAPEMAANLAKPAAGKGGD
jgi:xanthine dehydrogenase iron-sulfur cluster and FAD-binding subunit A